MSNKRLFRQAFNLLCDEKIGQGMSRTVYSSKLLPHCVIKVEDSHAKFQNIVEWETWHAAIGTKASAWLAECKWISGDGSILVMERTRPAAPSEIPAKVPDWLTDFKRSNYGMVATTWQHGAKKGQPGKSRFVCHDYGTNLAIDRVLESNKLRKFSFYGETA